MRDPAVGLSTCLLDRGVAVGLGGGGPRGGVPAGLGNSGVSSVLGFGPRGFRLVRVGLRGGELRCHLFRCCIGLGAELALLGGTLLSGGSQSPPPCKVSPPALWCLSAGALGAGPECV